MAHSWILGVIFLTVVAPMWISAHYGTRWRKSRGLSREDEKTMAELWESARRLEARVEGLEKILDAQGPGRARGRAVGSGAANRASTTGATRPGFIATPRMAASPGCAPA